MNDVNTNEYGLVCKRINQNNKLNLGKVHTWDGTAIGEMLNHPPPFKLIETDYG